MPCSALGEHPRRYFVPRGWLHDDRKTVAQPGSSGTKKRRGLLPQIGDRGSLTGFPTSAFSSPCNPPSIGEMVPLRAWFSVDFTGVEADGGISVAGDVRRQGGHGKLRPNRVVRPG